jgi:hypothetical protein
MNHLVPNLTSTRLPEYSTIRILPSGINSTVRVRRKKTFPAQGILGAPTFFACGSTFRNL